MNITLSGGVFTENFQFGDTKWCNTTNTADTRNKVLMRL